MYNFILKLTSLCLLLLLSACTTQTSTEKTDTRSLSGTIINKTSEGFILKDSTGELHTVVSTKYNLEEFLNKPISATGQPSGSTLYIDKIE